MPFRNSLKSQRPPSCLPRFLPAWPELTPGTKQQWVTFHTRSHPWTTHSRYAAKLILFGQQVPLVNESLRKPPRQQNKNGLDINLTFAWISIIGVVSERRKSLL